MTVDFSTDFFIKNHEAERKWNNIFQVLKDKNPVYSQKKYPKESTKTFLELLSLAKSPNMYKSMKFLYTYNKQ